VPLASRGQPWDWRAHAALLVVQITFASQSVEGKIAMASRVGGGEEISPLALAMVRMFGAAVFFQTGVQLGQSVTERMLGAALLLIAGVMLVATRKDAAPPFPRGVNASPA
jgi:hypothetical protein